MYDVLRGIISRVLPNPAADSNLSGIRLNRYGEPIVEVHGGGNYQSADEGQRFTAINPTMGTGIAAALTQTFSDTAALAVIRNKDAVGGKRLYPDYIRLICTVAPASATAMHIALTT